MYSLVLLYVHRRRRDILWLSLGLVEACGGDGVVSGSTMTGAPTHAVTLDASELGPVTLDGSDLDPADVWAKCKKGIDFEHEGMNGPDLTDFEVVRNQWFVAKEDWVGISAQQGALVGGTVYPGGTKLLQGDAWIGAEFKGRLRCPNKHWPERMLKLDVQARISAVIPTSDGAGLTAYGLQILWPPVGSPAQSWTSKYTPGYAVALEGVWDDSTGEHRSSDEMITLTLESTAVGKCSQQFHYLPWVMPELHAACVRMVRADYCGNGTSATLKDTLVDVWDTANVNMKEPNSAARDFEAAWTSAGAVCLGHQRVPILAKPCAAALPSCHSPEEAKALAREGGFGDVLLFNASCEGVP